MVEWQWTSWLSQYDVCDGGDVVHAGCELLGCDGRPALSPRGRDAAGNARCRPVNRALSRAGDLSEGARAGTGSGVEDAAPE